MLDGNRLNRVFTAVGELLAERNVEIGIVIVGGASLNLRGMIERTTQDVDVIALARAGSRENEYELVPPDPLPEELQDATGTVARDFSLPDDWMNAEIGAQWELGLPPSLERDLKWRQYGGLHVGLVGRETLIALKLFAAVDRGPGRVHVQDLIALRPTPRELREAARWVRSQDVGESYSAMVDDVVQHVNEHVS